MRKKWGESWTVLALESGLSAIPFPIYCEQQRLCLQPGVNGSRDGGDLVTGDKLLKAHSLTYLVSDAGYSLGTQLGLLARASS